MPMIWQIALLLFAGGMFLFGLACVIFAAQRFLTVAIVEIKQQISASRNLSTLPANGDIQSRMKELEKRTAPTDGGFDPYDENEMYVREKIEELRARGVLDDTNMDPREAEALVEQSLRDMDSQDTKG